MAKATRLTVRMTGRGASVRILVDGRKMPPGQGALPAYMEGTKTRWQHPVYGNRGNWAKQRPHPYFYKVVRPLGRRARSAVTTLLEDVTKRIS